MNISDISKVDSLINAFEMPEEESNVNLTLSFLRFSEGIEKPKESLGARVVLSDWMTEFPKDSEKYERVKRQCEVIAEKQKRARQKEMEGSAAPDADLLLNFLKSAGPRTYGKDFSPSKIQVPNPRSDEDIAQSTRFENRLSFSSKNPPVETAYDQEELDLQVCLTVNALFQKNNLAPRYQGEEITKLIDDHGWRFKPRPIEKRTQDEILEQDETHEIIEQIIERVYHQQKARYIKNMSKAFEILGIRFSIDEVRGRIEDIDSSMLLMSHSE